MEFAKKDNTHPSYIQLPESGDLPSIFKSYLQKTASEAIREICEPLKEIGITYFLYVKKFKDGSYIHLTNHVQSHQYFYENHLYTKTHFEDPKQNYLPGLYLWSGAPCQEVYRNFRDLFNIDNGITIVQTYLDCQEFYHFGSTRDNKKIINFYLNNLELLKRFILYFKDKTSDILQTIAQQHVVFPIRNHDYAINEFKQISKDHFIQQTTIKKYYLSLESSDTYLTGREIQCLKWYVEGKTAIEIAMILSISKRTVEKHLDNTKLKVNCFKKKHLDHNLREFILKAALG